jgi:hypothetical protein
MERRSSLIVSSAKNRMSSLSLNAFCFEKPIRLLLPS